MYKKLATAILLQAVQDFRTFPTKIERQRIIIKDLHNGKKLGELEATVQYAIGKAERRICLLEGAMKDLEVFFKSEWCYIITDYNGKELLGRLKQLEKLPLDKKVLKVMER